ncbi:MAG: EFR1 family ferrodoxin [Bacteroidales bacterium]|jgi:ferredoxin|nr:EFR1 family ferrodoxin [Bacteroidales bacterium]
MFTLLYFSPTGNARHLTDKLASHLEPHVVKKLALEFTDPKDLNIDEHLVIIYPIHGFNAPRTVKRFVKDLPPKSLGLVSLIGVGCNTIWVNDAVSSDLRKQLNKKGFSIMVDEILAMPLTFVINFPDELIQKLIQESEQKIKSISNSLVNENVSKRNVPAKSYIINFLGKGESPAARLFGLELHANKQCTSCGMCWENCPEKNITQGKNEKPKFGFSCLMCMRCIYNCPEKAISPRVSKFIPIKNGYSLSKHL